jgi:hypothetical protein
MPYVNAQSVAVTTSENINPMIQQLAGTSPVNKQLNRSPTAGGQWR